MAINYNRGMSQRGEFVNPSLATELLQRHVNPLMRVTDVRKLYGGSVNRVLEFILDREPGSVVAKLHNADAAEHFATEIESLRFFREHTRFPVPEPLAYIENDKAFDGAMLIMQKVNGTTLESAVLNAKGKLSFQRELGAAVAELHSHHAEKFGPATSAQSQGHWLDVFAPTAEHVVEDARAALPSNCREVLDHVVQHLPQWLGHTPKPTLIHGDLWANNILLNDAKPDQPRILAFIDGRASYADPEYELAYLQLFGTAGNAFFDIYTRKHKIDAGYQRRCRVYWLITMLQNAKRFGERYVPQCERIANELRQFAR